MEDESRHGGEMYGNVLVPGLEIVVSWMVRARRLDVEIKV